MLVHPTKAFTQVYIRGVKHLRAFPVTAAWCCSCCSTLLCIRNEGMIHTIWPIELGLTLVVSPRGFVFSLPSDHALH